MSRGFINVPAAEFDIFMGDILRYTDAGQLAQLSVKIQTFKDKYTVKKPVKKATSSDNFKEKVVNVFKQLRESEQLNLEGSVAAVETIELSVNNLSGRPEQEMVTILRDLLNQERLYRRGSLILAYTVGYVIHLLKSKYRSTARVVAVLSLPLSRQAAEKKLKLYTLLTRYPRLRRCNVSSYFIQKNAKLIESGITRQDDLWTS